MKRILIITGAIPAILIAALIIVPFLVPTSVYKTQIEAAASTALDRRVTDFTTFYRLGDDVTNFLPDA